MQVDPGGRRWTKVDEGGCRWMQMDKSGWMWRKVDAGGPEYDVRVPRIPGTGIFSHFFVVKLVPDKVSEPTLEKLGTGKKSRSRYR